MRARWFSRLGGSRAARLRLFCFPFAGGSARVFHAWCHALGDDVAVFGLSAPGREQRAREANFTRLAPLVRALVDELSLLAEPPYVLFGYSLGALVAYEAARELRRRGRPEPAHLIVAAHRAPHLVRTSPSLHALPRDRFIAALEHLNGSPREVLRDPELIDLWLPALRADFAIAETYVHPPEAPLSCAISAISGSDDTWAKPSAVAAWHTHTLAAFEHHVLRGHHFFINSERDALIQYVARALNADQPRRFASEVRHG